MILARSVSGYAQVSAKVEEMKKESKNKFNSSMISCCAFVIAPFLIGMTKSGWERELMYAELRSSDIYKIIILIECLWAFVIAARGKERLGKIQNIDDQYRYFASLESLVADGEKIYGTTIRGPIALYYNQIESTGIFVQPWEIASNDTVTVCDAFAVRDTSGNSYQFYSFQNCNELKTVVDMKITETRNR